MCCACCMHGISNILARMVAMGWSMGVHPTWAAASVCGGRGGACNCTLTSQPLAARLIFIALRINASSGQYISRLAKLENHPVNAHGTVLARISTQNGGYERI